MNERIQELANKAGFTECKYRKQLMAPESFSLAGEELKKFAELIIKECLHIVDDEGAGEGGCIRAMIRIQDEFGVEE